MIQHVDSVFRLRCCGLALRGRKQEPRSGVEDEAAKGSAAGATASTQDMAHNFNVCAWCPLSDASEDGSIFPAFWCMRCVSNIAGSSNVWRIICE